MFGWFRQKRSLEAQILLLLIKRNNAMALQLDKLNAAVARSSKATDNVLALLKASEPDPTVEVAAQAALDSAAGALDEASAKVEAVLPPASPPPDPATTGAG